MTAGVGGGLLVETKAHGPEALLLRLVVSLRWSRDLGSVASPGLDFFAVLLDVLDKPSAALVWG